MVKPLYSTNEKGFILPYVLFMVLLIFILLSSGIKTYRNDQNLTDYYIEHIRVETLYQMAHVKFHQEIESSNNPPQPITKYQFTDGSVIIRANKVSEQLYDVMHTITTKKLGFQYTFSYSYQIANNN